jgi:hypothetical protein
MKKQYPGFYKPAFATAVASVCLVWLCCPQQARAQWTTDTNAHTTTTTDKVGVGTSAPNAKLDVEGSAPYNVSGVFSALYAKGTADYPMALMLDGAGTNDNVARLRALNNGQTKWQINFGDDVIFSSWLNSNFNSRFSISAGGNVGIGTTAPLQRLQVGNNTETATATPDSISLGATYSSAAGANPKLRLWDNNAGVAYGLGVSNSQFDFMVPTGARYVWSVNGAEKMRLDESGNVTVAGNISAKYQDMAEWVPSSQRLSAGTVVVLDTTQTNHVLASTKSYDTKVAGVVSASPGVILGEGGDGKLKVATTGRVKVRVDATRSPIKVGDLLVTSDVEGVAMKSVPVDLGGTPIHRPGTIIGKALEPLDKGTGEILVLLSLQ